MRWLKEDAMEDRPILLFDGRCNLCTWSVDAIVKRERDVRFLIAPFQSDTGKQFLETCGVSPDNPESLIVIEGGRCLQKGDAALFIASRVSGPWRLLNILRLLPKRARDRLYDFVAARRNRWQ